MLCAVTEPIPRITVPSGEPRAIRSASGAADGVSWSVQTSGIDTSLRGISAANTVDANGANHITVWASGSNGVILFSSDLGKTWSRLHLADGDSLDFRSIVAFDAKRAYVMSSGNGDKSRIYETKDGGETWKLEFTGKKPHCFSTRWCATRSVTRLAIPSMESFCCSPTTTTEPGASSPVTECPTHCQERARLLLAELR
jgi:photosystem II stability/assembly factor-like uncharacterized protein